MSNKRRSPAPVRPLEAAKTQSLQNNFACKKIVKNRTIFAELIKFDENLEVLGYAWNISLRPIRQPRNSPVFPFAASNEWLSAGRFA
jgi:hypothetical protein